MMQDGSFDECGYRLANYGRHVLCSFGNEKPGGNVTGSRLWNFQVDY